ncbi:MAG: NYN domain-containing protein, partial [Synechococcaceae bacterium WB4_1_0192]|nr:NYN domain-containing protein [Synechococcaceae bacterium WB4_1_0192]
LSGSRDLERLLEVLRVRGLKTVLIHADGMAPRELRNAADRFLDLASLRPQLERLEGQPQAAASRTL